MASLYVGVLAQGGATFGGPVGLFAAQLAASYIDSTFIYPALFGKPDAEIPKMADVSVSGANEGGQIAVCIGPEVRVPLSIIWANNDPVVVYNENSSGKGGGGPSVTTLSYFQYVTYAACRAPAETLGVFTPGVREISRVWLDGKTLYDKNVDVHLRVSECAVEVHRFVISYNYGNDPPTPYYGYYLTYVLLGVAGSQEDFLSVQPGTDVTVSGFSNGDYNATNKVYATGSDAATGFLKLQVQTHKSVWLSNPGGTGGADGVAPPSDIPAEFIQNNTEFSSDDMDAVQIRTGTRTQTAHYWEEQQEGIGNVPGYRGLVTIHFERLALSQFGNRIPTGHALVKAHDELTLGQAIRIIILSFSDLTEADIDTSTLEEIEFLGYAIQGRQAASQMLQPILLAYDIIMVEVDDQLIFLERSAAPTHLIDANSLGARRNGGEYVTNVNVTDTADIKLPDRVIVKYIDPDNGWQQGSTSERRPNAGTSGQGGEVVEVNFNLTLREQQARQIASRFLYDPLTTRRSITVSLMPSEVSVSEGSILSFTDGGYDWLMLVDKLDRGSDFSYVAEGVAEKQHLRILPSISTETGGASIGLSTQYVPPQLLYSLFNAPALKASQGIAPTLSLAVAAFQRDTEWRGAEVLRNNPNAGNTYTHFGNTPGESVMGITTTVLPAITNASVINHTASFNVELNHGDVFTVPFQEFLDGANIAFIGEECISFQTVTHVNGNIYTLSGLRRGLAGTADVGVSDAEIGSTFVLNSNAITKVEYPPSLVGFERNYLVVPSGGTQSDYDENLISTTGRNAIYWEQAHIRGQRASLGDNFDPSPVVIKWNRTSRIRGTLFEDAPDFEGVHLYRVRIYKGNGVPSAVNKRVDTIISVGSTGATEYHYSSSAQDSHQNTGEFSVIINRVGDFGHSPYNTYTVLPNL